MLTEAEKKWLEERQDKGEYNFYYCQYCNKMPSMVTSGLCAGTCPMYPGGFEYEDAAEFEARKAVMAIDGPEVPLPCHELHAKGIDDCPYDMRGEERECADCFEKAVNLAVEQEMES